MSRAAVRIPNGFLAKEEVLLGSKDGLRRLKERSCPLVPASLPDGVVWADPALGSSSRRFTALTVALQRKEKSNQSNQI